MSNTPIKKSFLFKLSPPFIRRLAPPNLLNVPIYIITNICSVINSVIWKYGKLLIISLRSYRTCYVDNTQPTIYHFSFYFTRVTIYKEIKNTYLYVSKSPYLWAFLYVKLVLGYKWFTKF